MITFTDQFSKASKLVMTSVDGARSVQTIQQCRSNVFNDRQLSSGKLSVQYLVLYRCNVRLIH